MDDDNVEGETGLFRGPPAKVGGALSENRWRAGDQVAFQVMRPGGPPDLGEDDVVTVRVVHLPSQSIVIDRSIELQDG